MHCDECGGKIAQNKDEYVCLNCGVVYGSVLKGKPVEKTHPYDFFSSKFYLGSVPGNSSFLKSKTVRALANKGGIQADMYVLNAELLTNARSFFQLPQKCLDRATAIYRELLKTEKINTSYVYVAVALYKAVSEYQLPITLQEIVDFVNMYKKKPISMKTINAFIREKKVKIPYIFPSVFIDVVEQKFLNNSFPSIPRPVLYAYFRATDTVAGRRPLLLAYSTFALIYHLLYDLKYSKINKIIPYNDVSIRHAVSSILSAYVSSICSIDQKEKYI